MKTSTQLEALVRNLSKEKNVEAEIILRNFMLERLLECIAVSKYRDNFILKGGMLIAAMVGIDTLEKTVESAISPHRWSIRRVLYHCTFSVAI